VHEVQAWTRAADATSIVVFMGAVGAVVHDEEHRVGRGSSIGHHETPRNDLGRAVLGGDLAVVGDASERDGTEDERRD
jgi:hypothetical protein